MQGMEEYTDNLETNGAGAATPCGRCAASQFRLVVAHEVGRDCEQKGACGANGRPPAQHLWDLVGKRPDPAAGTQTLRKTLAGQAMGSCSRGEPQIVDCAAVTALRGCRGRCAGGQARRRLATGNARRGAGGAGDAGCWMLPWVSLLCSSSTVWL